MATILVVEDDLHSARIIKIILQSEGYNILEANDAKKAIHIANEDKPDLILMDIGLKEMDGLTATQKLKNDPLTKDIPVIAITAYAMTGDKEKILKICDEYISKPFKADQLKGTVSKVLAKKQI
jgi:two-component system, cell cycle response regulator DivK